MKINSLSQIDFQKKLRANSQIKKNDTEIPVEIYELDNKFDVFDLKKAAHSPIWENTWYLQIIISDFFNPFKKNSFYIMENPEKELLCVCEVGDKNTKTSKLHYIETAPRYSKQNRFNRPFKYIGETMLAFLVCDAKEKGKKEFIVPDVAARKSTEDFYFEQCKMKKVKNGAKLNKEDFSRFLKQNAKHTGAFIDKEI